MKIAFFEVEGSELFYFNENLKGHELQFYSSTLSDSDLKSLTTVEVLSPFIYSQLTKERLQNMPCLKLIITRSTGYDHIDMKYCKRAGITVCNVPKYGGTAVAEHTVGLMLSLARHIPLAVEKTTHDDFSLDKLQGFELTGKTLGVVGVGMIGQSVVRIAKALGMQVLAYERNPDKKRAEELGFTPVDFKELLKRSDIVSIHVPYTKETHHLFDKGAFKRMKPTAYLINTARGPIVDTEDLVKALDEGWIAGCALDVLEGETDLHEASQPLKQEHFFSHDWRSIRRNHALLKRENVIITPHMAFYTKEALATIHEATVKAIFAFQSGQPINTIS